MTIEEALAITGCERPSALIVDEHQTADGVDRQALAHWPCGLELSIEVATREVAGKWATALSKAHYAHHHYGHGTWPSWLPFFTHSWPDGDIQIVSCDHYDAAGRLVSHIETGQSDPMSTH